MTGPCSHPNTDYNLVGPNPVLIDPTAPGFGSPLNFVVACPPLPAPTGQYVVGSIREFDPVTSVCFGESPLGASTSQIDICQATPPTVLCACPTGPGQVWNIPSVFTFRYFCLPLSGTVTFPSVNPCSGGGTLGVVATFAARYPSSGSTALFPAGRDVFQWFALGDMTQIAPGFCSPNVMPNGSKEFLSGTTTLYIPGTAFIVVPWGVGPNLSGSQSDWNTHHQLPSNQSVFGAPTVGTLIVSGQN